METHGVTVTSRELADGFLRLQYLGCHNVHWVSPTHQLFHLLEALALARRCGLTLPIVYNTGGYESVETLRCLGGHVQVYLPDFKFWSEDLARRYTRVRGYPEHARNAIVEMKRQVGDLILDDEGVARQGLLIRHLVMPGMLEDAKRIYDWIVRELGPHTAVHVMPQYRPEFQAEKIPELARETTTEEWFEAMALAKLAGLVNLMEEPWHPLPVKVTPHASTNRPLMLQEVT